MAEAVRNVLFLSMRNSARSIMAECIMNREGGGRFKGFSAGMQPVEELSQQAVELLRKLNHSVNGMGPKSLDAYADGGAPKMDFVFVVDDTAAEMDLPQLPGKPMVARWKFPDPESHEGSGTERKAMFADVYGRIYNRISIFVNLPFESLDRLALQRRIEEMGATRD